MDISQLIRNKAIVHDALVQDGDKLLAKKGMKIYIPVRFSERNLAVIGSETSILGIFAIVVDDKYYAVSNALAMLRIEPTSTNTVTVGDEDYFEFYFEAGSVVVADTQVVVDDTVAYYVYNEFIAKGRAPWYLSY